MPVTEQNKQLLDAIAKGLTSLSTYKIETLLREAELGRQLSFKIGEPIITKVLELFQRVQDCELDGFSHSSLNNLLNSTNNANSIFLAIKNFNPSSGNPVAMRDNYLAQLENNYDSFFQACLPFLVSDLLKSTDLTNDKLKIDEALQSFQEEKNRSLKDSLENEKQIKLLLEKARLATSQIGVVSHSVIFLEESKRLRKLAMLWFAAMVLLLGGIILLCLYFLNVLPDNTKGTEYFIQYTISRVIMLTVLFYGIGISNRNYKAYKHNELINKHRHNALNTFEAFAKAAGEDIQTKNAVLLEATHTIFSNQQTGYLSSESDSDNPNKIIEIVKNITSKPSSGGN